MRLVSLRLAGFKSFADKTTLPLAPGINAVIGPNGSGKSNLIDGLRWATGGGRANAFRAEDKTELIFHGTRQHKTLGYAEVEVRLEHERTPIVINRNLSRDGSSKLKLAGKNARFLDVDELLAGSGLGRSGLAVIGQGEVSEILTASPAALLDTIAEAAGVTRLTQRRDKTDVRLEQAQSHLDEVVAWLATLAERYHQLQREAQQAASANALERAILRLRYTLVWTRQHQLADDISKLNDQYALAQNQQQASEQALAQAQQRWQAAQKQHHAAETAWHEWQRHSESVRGDIRVAETRIEAFTQRINQYQQDLTRLEREQGELAVLTAPEAPEQADVDGHLRMLARALSALNPQLESVQTEYRHVTRELEDAQHKQQQCASAQQVYESQRQQYQEQLTALKALESPPRAESDLTQLEQNVTHARRNVDDLQVTFEREQATLRAAQQLHANAAAEVLALERQQTRLEQAFSQRTGYAYGAKVVLRSAHPDVIAAVGDLLDIPDEYRAAISSALGRRAENIVIRQSAAASAILQEVRRVGGYATLLPLDLLHPSRPTAPPFAHEPGVIGVASELVGVADTYQVVTWQLLGRTVIVETLEQATNLAKRFSRRPRLVTLTGDVVENYGAISGGKANRGDDGRVLKRDVVAGARALDAARALASEHENQCQQLNTTLESLRQKLQQAQGVLEQAQTTLNHAREQQAREQATMNAQKAQYETTAAALANLRPPEKPATNLPALTARASRLREHLIALNRQRQTLQQQQQQVSADERIQQEQWRNYQTALQNYQTSRARLERLSQEIQQTQLILEQTQNERTTVSQALTNTRAQLPDDSKVKAALEQAQRDVQQCQKNVETHNQHHAKNAAACRDLSMAIARKQASLEAAESDMADFPEGLEPLSAATTIRAEVNVAALGEDVVAWLTELEIWPEHTSTAKMTALTITDTSAKTLKRCLQDAERECAQLGAVNYRAAHELQDTAEHLRNLSRDAKDAQDAVTSLQQALRELDSNIQQQLEHAVSALRSRFQEKVTVLFGENAHADLRLSYEEGRPSGVTLALQPANKTTRSLNLLSVGERTMGAMAFLFALMEGEHALPIAILDEVDAPLDEANIRRFRDFVRQLAQQGTQFLLITHQKATMECADVLWGVTTQDGISRIFSIQRDEAMGFDDAAD